jgi:hypothetical protein
MARLIPQKQIEEVNIFKDSISVNNSVFISGSLIVSQSVTIGSNLNTKQRITGSVEITGSLEIDGTLSFADAQSRLDATSSFSEVSVDTQRFGGILPEDFGASAATIYVSSTKGDDSNPGTSPAFPLRTIKRAAQLATPGDDGRYGLPTGSLFTGFRIDVDTGTYVEDNPIELPRNTTVWGSGLRVTKIVAKNENEDLFWVNSGCYLSEMTFAGLRVYPSVDDSQKGFAISFAPNAFITTSPYVQNCSMISNQENSFLEKYEEIPAGGGGLNIDGNRIHPDSPLASMVLDAYTQIAPNGVGCQVVGRGFIQLVSFFTNFSAYSVKVIDGGQAVLLNSNTSFGDYGMYASGSRFITGSGGNTEAFLNVQDNYSIIVNTIERGLDEIPDLVPNTDDGIKTTTELQYFTSGETATNDDAAAVVSDYRLIANLIERGVENKLPILALSSDRGYNSGSVWNVSGDVQITSSFTASNEHLEVIDGNYDIVLDIIERGNAATSSYSYVDNTDSLIQIDNVTQYKTSAVTDDTKNTIGERFDTIISIIQNGPLSTTTGGPQNRNRAIIETNTSQSFKVTDTQQYISDLSSSLEVRTMVSSSLSIVYDILNNGTGSAPIIIQSSSIENPTVDYQNAYTLLIENIPFIQSETVAYLSSSWSEFEYNQSTCQRDISYIVSGAAHDLLYGGNEESVRNGNFYYLYPSDTTTTQKEPTLTAIKYVVGMVDNILGNVEFQETTAEADNAYDLLFNNKRFIQSESIAYISSSWSTFEYNEAKCVRDVGYIIDAVATDIKYGGNERSVIAGNFYYKYPSQATVSNTTEGGQLNQTIDGIKYAKRIAEKLVKNETFVTQSEYTLAITDTLFQNRSLIQDETITYINTTYPNFSYNEAKCRRDTGYILDGIITDLKYGGVERSQTAGLYYYLYPSIANTTQLEETLEGIRYAKGFTLEVAKSNIIEEPSIKKNINRRIKVGNIEYITSSISGTEFEAKHISGSIGIVEDIIKFGNDSMLSAIAENSSEFQWEVSKPLSVSSINQITSSITESANISNLVDNFGIVTDIINGGTSAIPQLTSSWENLIKITDTDQYLNTGSVATSTEATLISESISIVANIVQNGVDSLPPLTGSVNGLIKIGSVSQNTNYSGSLYEANRVSSSFATITNIVENGVGVIPTIVSNISESIKFNDSVQYISSSFSGSLEDVSFISSSISYVTTIIANGTGSYTASEYPSQPLSSSNAIAAYQILRNNLDFIKDETISYLSSSWSTASYDESKCRRDVGLIISGAAEDLIWGTVSSSIVNGRFYYDYPSQAQGAQLNQTLDGIFFASEVAQKLIQNIEFVTASVERRGAWDSITNNEEFIKEEMIQYLSSSWSTFDYNEATCRRDAGYILDAVKTDIYYGGNERSAIAGNFYYLYPSQATGSQLNQTLDGLRYAGRVTEAVVSGSTFVSPSQAVLDTKDLLLNNKTFIQNETIAYISSSWSEFSYNETTCKRDVGFILDAAITDVIYGGNERSRIAANFYYRYPSAAIVGGVPSLTQQKDPTVDGIKFAGGISEKIVLGEEFTSADSNKITLKDSIIENKSYVQQNVIDYINKTYPNLNYNNDKCFRDIGFIIDAVVTDLVYGGNGRSVQAGSFYYRFPSQATYSQLTETIDGINYGRDLVRLVSIGAKSVEDGFDTVIKIIESGSSIVTEETIGTGSAPLLESLIGDPISTIGVPKNSYGAGLVQMVTTTSIPTFDLVENVSAGIKFGNDIQITGSITASSDEVTKVSSSFSDIIDIVRYGTSGSLSLSGSYDTSTYYEVITPESGDYYILNQTQLQKFDGVSAGGYFNPLENTGSFEDGIKDPTITLKRGEMYTFSVNALKYDLNPFYIKTARKADKEALYNEGVTNNGVNFGTLTFIVPLEAPDRLYYVNGNNVSASGIINVVDNLPISDTQKYIEVPSKGFVEVTTNNVDNIKVSDVVQYSSSLSASVDESNEISSSYATVIDVLSNGIENLPTISKNASGLVKKSSETQYTSSISATNGIINRVTSSFDVVLDIIENGIGSLPTLIENTEDLIKGSSTSQFTSSLSGSSTEVSLVSSSFAIVLDIIKNGVDSLPIKIYNTTNSIKKTTTSQYISASSAESNEVTAISSSVSVVTDIISGGTGSAPTIVENVSGLIKSTNLTQFTGSLSGSLEDISFVSSSVSIVSHMITYGSGSYLTASNYVSPSTDPATIAVYEILRENIGFIQSESIAYLSSSWTTASYDESKCARDIGLIISGAAEDLIWNTYSASIVNGKFYLEYPSQAETSQLNQTLDGIFYASKLAQQLIQNNIYQTASLSKVVASELIDLNREFIQNETIAYLSSSWSTFDYNETLCRRDVSHILDAVRTDVFYGGNERSVKAGNFYYRYPSAATGSQLNQTLDGVNYAGRLAQNIVQNIEFTNVSTNVSASYELIRNNIDFVKEEAIAYLSSSWSTFDYNETTCKRDVGYILDAVTTDLYYGGNERSVVAGEFYYLYPSDATGSQLNQTLDGVNYARRVVENIIVDNQFATAPFSRTNGKDLLFENKEFIKEETIAYLSSSWSEFDYNETTCKRDVGYIVDAVVTDLVYGGNERSITAGEFYYLYPSAATGSQLIQTLDGVKYAKNLSIELLQNNVFELVSDRKIGLVELIIENKELIKEETIQFLSSSWSTFEYNEEKCRRDTGYIVDAVVTDFVYGGNERTVKAGEFYYLYPSEATGSQLDQTVDGITYAQRLTNKLINNVTLVNVSNERQATYDLIFDNKELIQNEVIHFMSSSWSDFEYNEAKCSRDVGFILDAIATDILYGGNERTVTAGEYYYKYPSQATTTQLNQTITGVKHAAGLANKIIQNSLLVSPDGDVLETYNRIRNNREFIQSETIEFVDNLYPFFTYDRVKCRRDVGYILDAIATDLLWGGNERSIIAGDFYYRFPSQATTFQLDQTIDGIEYAKALTKEVILNNVIERPRIIFNTENHIKVDGVPQYSDSMVISGSYLTEISSSFELINNVILGGLDNLPKEQTNIESLTKVTDAVQSTNSLTQSVSDISSSFAIVIGVIQNGVSSIPTIVSNTNSNIKVGNIEQYISSSASGSLENLSFVSSSIDIVTDIIANGSGSYLTASNYVSASTDESTIAAYQILRENIDFIQDETITYLSSSWSGFDYNEAKCRRDVGLIVSGTAEDLIWNANSASIVNGKFYLEYPSQATGSQLDQTLDGIFYASNLAQKLIQNIEFVTASSDVVNSYNSILNEKATIQSKVITYLSSSFPTHNYNESKCSRDVGYIIDGVATDLLYGGNERSVKSGNYYFKYPSQATGYQLEETVAGIEYAQRLTEVASQNRGTQIGIISASIDLINDIIRFGSDDTPFAIAKHFQTSELDTPQQLTTSSYVLVDGDYDVTTEKVLVSQSFSLINDIIENTTSSIAGFVDNAFNNRKFSNVTQYESDVTASATELTKVYNSFGIVADIVENGLSQKPTIVRNNIGTSPIKVTSTEQYISASAADKLQAKIVSSSVAIVADIIENGSGSAPTIIEYTTPSDSPKAKLAYQLIRNNIDFIKDETIAYLSSSWSNFNYNEASCSRDVGLIISGAAEDLIWNSNSASVVNGKFYLEYPSAATGSQLQQTLDGVRYASNLAQHIVRNRTFVTASAEVSASYDLLFANKEFIKEETIAYISSSWSDFSYDQETCKRDVGYIVDAVATDLLYGGNERSITAGDYYYRYPSSAIVGGVPSATQQKDPTVTGINYAKSLALELLSGSTFQTASNEVEFVYDSIRENRAFIQAETVAFVNAKYPNLEYNEASCSRDAGFIVDAVATDLRWGGNQRSIVAGQYYYKFPSQATTAQLGETTDAVIYASNLVSELIDKNTLPIPSASLNSDGNIKVTGATQWTGSLSANQSDINFVSSSIDIVTTIISEGSGSYLTASNYVTPSTDVNTLAAYQILRNNIDFIKGETIAYLSSSWSSFPYNEASCSRDVGLIISGAAEDLVWNSDSASIVNGKFYLEYPSAATGSQLDQTLDGIFYASRLAQKLIQNIEFVEPSTEASSSWELMRNNRLFIQSESIAYLSSSWSDFSYDQETCKRDIGYIIDAISTDILYGGNERSVTAGNYYYKYPSSATSAQLDPTITGINYAGDMIEKVIVNEVFQSPSAERIAGNESLLNNRTFIQSESLAYLTASWSTFEYNKDKCARDVGYIVDAVATDFLYGGNERSRTAGEYYYLYPSEATSVQANQTTDGVKYAGRIAEALVQNIQFVTASSEVSASFDLLRKNKPFIAEEVIQYVSSSWSGVYYDEAKCRRDTGYIVDAAATDLLYGGNERSVIAGNYYFKYPSSATERGTPSVVAQLDPTVTGVKYTSGLAQNVIQNVEFYQPSASVLVASDLLLNNKTFIQKETIAFLSSSWSEFPYNEVSCSRDLGYIIDAVRTDLVYGGNERSIQAATFYYYIPSVAITEQKPQTIDGIDFAKGISEKVILQDQLTFAGLNRRNGYADLRAAKKYLQSKAISYTNAAFPGFVYNEEKCYRDTGFILDAISTDLLYGGNERSIEAAKSYYTGVYGDASAVINEQKKETAEANRYLRTLFQKVARNAPLELFGSLIITTGHDFSYAGAGVTYKALPPNQGGNGVPDPDKEIVELGGGRVFFTSGNELGDFRIGTGLVINQATGTLQGRTFSRSLFSLVTPFSLALEG